VVAKVKVETSGVMRALGSVESKVRNLSEAHKAEAEMLLPDVQSATRRASGDLAGGWQTDGIATEAKFTNDIVYAGVQEWGWPDHNISPTHAILQAFESNASKTEALYGDAIAKIGDGAGFNVKQS